MPVCTSWSQTRRNNAYHRRHSDRQGARAGWGPIVSGRRSRHGRIARAPFAFAGAAEVERACALAWTAFQIYRETGLEERARFLETIAANIMDLGHTLIGRASAETGLPRGRIEGERARTVGQLKLFADVVRAAEWLDLRIDHAIPDRKPMPRADLRLRNAPLGPVAVFGASNFSARVLGRRRG